ncbi:T6SS immunity protein Tdi1 domain-containing protein [Lentzea sp. DG1S-22]|uniref:T6SS immunity protein Tdi1 domain-containing protein n=1 Tax=Lentzea sp. DG1S-22 TaxID=3108822 RepID=UPI002E79AF55|nr:T6SS immunity protein Tdi1 domain-containing protein [Lentzea sp. DG1S-22]WVH79751.1 T6SS immunity protein Tdi1 domain-containing protein [Lentzea sp. DG1S-22]
MFDRFTSAYPLDAGQPSPPADVEPLRQVPGLAELVTLAAGLSFGDGILRVFTEEEARRAQVLANRMWPEWAPRLRPVAQDWMARQYVLDLHRGAALLLLDPGAAGVYELDGTIHELLDTAAIEDPDTFLSQHLFTAWRDLHPEPVPAGACVGFKTPLFLGGPEAVENLEVVDEEVYWSIHGQLWAKVKDLPEGTPISGVEIN